MLQILSGAVVIVVAYFICLLLELGSPVLARDVFRLLIVQLESPGALKSRLH